MRIITISGSAQHGKDSTATILKDLIEQDGKRAIIVHYADYLKYLCREYFGWNGQKDEIGRTLLQQVGTELCRKNNPDIWVRVICELAKAIETEFDYMIIPDTRFKNEIEEWRYEEFSLDAIRVTRPNFDNGLTEEQKNHQSEKDLDEYDFDYEVVAENIGELKFEVAKMWREFIRPEPLILACDFDGTIVECDFPRIGKPRWDVINAFKELKERGAELVLWTCREGKLLKEAVDACESYGLVFNHINSNVPTQNEKYGNDSRKLGASYYVDDKSLRPEELHKLLEVLKNG